MAEETTSYCDAHFTKFCLLTFHYQQMETNQEKNYALSRHNAEFHKHNWRESAGQVCIYWVVGEWRNVHRKCPKFTQVSWFTCSETFCNLTPWYDHHILTYNLFGLSIVWGVHGGQGGTAVLTDCHSDRVILLFLDTWLKPSSIFYWHVAFAAF